jgi:hypothetical protein
MTSMLSKNDAFFCKNCLSRIIVSHGFVESEVYKRCISLLGDFGHKKPLIWRHYNKETSFFHKNL